MSTLAELDPQAKSLLHRLRANTAQQTITARREAVKSLLAQVAPPFEPLSATRDFVIESGAAEIAARLYIPQAKGSLRPNGPALIYYHGGGFVAGDLETHDTLVRALANRAGCRVISVAYRLAPEDPYPAANEDAWSALTWVGAHAAEFGIDPNRIAVGGDSAGGTLAAWVAQRAAKQGLSLRLQVLLYPSLDMTISCASWRELGTGDYLVSRAGMSQNLDAYLPPGIDRKDPLVSPLFATDLTAVAPAVIVTADHDPLRDEGDEYARKLQSAGITVEHTCWPGMIHGFASMAGALNAGQLVINQIGTALREALA